MGLGTPWWQQRWEEQRWRWHRGEWNHALKWRGQRHRRNRPPLQRAYGHNLALQRYEEEVVMCAVHGQRFISAEAMCKAEPGRWRERPLAKTLARLARRRLLTWSRKFRVYELTPRGRDFSWSIRERR